MRIATRGARSKTEILDLLGFHGEVSTEARCEEKQGEPEDGY
jgi:hypothetical protein